MHAYLHCNINFVETGSMHQNVPSDLSASVPVWELCQTDGHVSLCHHISTGKSWNLYNQLNEYPYSHLWQ